MARRESTIRSTRATSNDAEKRVKKVLTTVEARLRRVAARRESPVAKKTYRDAAAVIHNLVKPRGRRS